MSVLDTALGKLHGILFSWDDQSKAMEIVHWYNSHMSKEIDKLKRVADAARPLLKPLELCQELDSVTEKGWKRELALQQALKELDEVTDDPTKTLGK